MATPVANLKIKLDGEAEYRQALSSIDKATKEIGSELNLLSAKFSKNGDSVEALTEKSEVLSKKFKTQQERVDVLKKAVEEAESIQKKAQKAFDETASTLDAGSEEYKAMAAQVQKAADQTTVWQTKLNNATADLYKMQDALDENAEALKSAGEEADKASQAAEDFGKATDDSKKKSDGFGGAVENLAGDLGIKIPPAAQKAATKLGGLGTAAGAVTVTVAALGAAVVAAEKKLVSMTKETAASAAELLKQSSIAGQSTQTIQELTYAGERLGVSYDRIQDSLKETTNKMQEARDGSEDVASAYQRLGIRITDSNGELRDAESVFWETIDALGEMENRTERDAIAMDLLSESARELNPLIEAGSGKIKAYAQEAKDMGYVLSNDDLNALKDVDTAVKNLEDSQEAFHNKLSAEFAPYLSEFLATTQDQIESTGDALVTSGIVDGLGMILDSVGGLISPMDELSDSTVPRMVRALQPLAVLLAAIADALQFFGGIASFFLTADPERFIRAFDAFDINDDNPSYSHQMMDLINDLEQQAADAKLESDFLKNRQSSSFGAGSGFGMISESTNTPKLGKVTSSDYLDTALNINKFGKTSNADAASQYREYLKDNSEFLSYDIWKKQRGYNAAGTDYWYGGRTLIGENGPEMAILPQGTRILTAQESRQASGGDVYNITIPASSIKEFEDIIRIVKNRRRVSRMEGEL